NRNATDALPDTRPDLLASSTEPVASAPAGTTVMPSTRIGPDRDPRTGSSLRLLSDETAVSSSKLIVVPAGTVTSRNRDLAGTAWSPTLLDRPTARIDVVDLVSTLAFWRSAGVAPSCVSVPWGALPDEQAAPIAKANMSPA